MPQAEDELGGFEKIIKIIATSIICFMIYGASIGIWRDAQMALYVSIKMPLLVGMTLLSNALLNGLLAILLGTGLSFRQSFMALLLSFAHVGLILASLAPVLLYFSLQLPASGTSSAITGHCALLLTHTAVIAFAGVSSNVHLFRIVSANSHSADAALRTLFAWLLGNTILGTQYAWILRPFFGSPELHVQFLRQDFLAGNFFITIWNLCLKLYHHDVLKTSVTLGIMTLIISLPILGLFYSKFKKTNL